MGLTDKLDKFMEVRGINKSQLAKEADVPYTTIDGFYKKGYENIKLSTLKKLAQYMGCSIDYLADDDVLDDKVAEECADYITSVIDSTTKRPEMQKLILALADATKNEVEKSTKIIELMKSDRITKEE